MDKRSIGSFKNLNERRGEEEDKGFNLVYLEDPIEDLKNK